MRFIKFIVHLLLIVGGINWGLWGLFQYDVVADLFGSNVATYARVVYILIGASAVLSICCLFSCCCCTCSCHKKEKK